MMVMLILYQIGIAPIIGTGDTDILLHMATAIIIGTTLGIALVMVTQVTDGKIMDMDVVTQDITLPHTVEMRYIQDKKLQEKQCLIEHLEILAILADNLHLGYQEKIQIQRIHLDPAGKIV